MPMHPPDPWIVHPLPPAPHFVGREAELEALRAAWKDGFRGVLTLIGLGGAGKTAVASRFVEELLRRGDTPRPEGLFVWSFYQEPDAGLFLREAYRYFARDASEEVPARGTGLLHLLRDALTAGGPHLLVLDGLERVQRQESDATGVFGQVEDSLLKGLLTRTAEGMGRTAALVTSRFPLTDLEPFRGPGYRHLDVGGLDPCAARSLLRSRGVTGDEAALDRLIETYGAHALTLDHLGGLIGQFLDGDPARAPELPALATPGDRQALRLTRLLRAYEDHLPPTELALLCRLCLLRRNVSAERIQQLFLCAPAVHARTVRELVDMVERLPGFEACFKDLQGKPRDLAESMREIVEEALYTAPLAGPEDTFRQEILLAAERGVELHEMSMEEDVAAVVRLYAGAALDSPTDRLPLSEPDRTALRKLHDRHGELRRHPLQPFGNVEPALEEAFQVLGYGKKSHLPLPEDVSPASVWRALQKAQLGMRYLSAKHFVLRRVRELCRLYQQKWSLAGPLAKLDATELRQVLDSLVARHLVLREADGSVSVHPAVRDHFHRLAVAAEGEAWHDIIREQLVSLVRRPGMRLPEDTRTLDLVEEAIHRALEAGRVGEAAGLYDDVLGGLRHLGWKLGEMARGLRILRGFRPCPDRWGLGWYLRALGEFEAAYAQNSLAFFRADIRLLQGRLPQVAAEGDEGRTAVAAFLMGQTTELPPDQLGCAIPREQILLYLGHPDRLRHTALLEGLYQDMGREGDRARCHLLLAEAARRQADVALCRKHLDIASVWVLHSGSVEHLCLFHRVRCRALRAAGDGKTAQHAVDEGLHIARQCGLGLYHIEFLCEGAELCLSRGDPAAAEQMARRAMGLAAAADCHFLWGLGEASHLVGLALLAQERRGEARDMLDEALATRHAIGDPRAEFTEELLTLLG